MWFVKLTAVLTCVNSQVYFEMVWRAEGFTTVGAVFYPSSTHSLPGGNWRYGGDCCQAIFSCKWRKKVKITACVKAPLRASIHNRKAVWK